MVLLYQLRRLVTALVFYVAVISLSGCGINNIPTYGEATEAAWGKLLNQYKRRVDLIPNLVKTVKEFAGREKEVLVELVEAGSKANSMQFPDDFLSNPDAFKQFQGRQDAISGALSKLMVVVERYPELKSDQNFQALQIQLEATENSISVARRDYIEAVRKYNTEIRAIPGRWWKSLLYSDAMPKESFTTPEIALHTPEA